MRKILERTGLISKRWFGENVGLEMKKDFLIIKEGGRGVGEPLSKANSESYSIAMEKKGP